MIKLSDSLFSSNKAKRHPLELLIVSFFYASLSIFISRWLIPEYASITSVFLTSISCLYLVQGILIKEESSEDDFVSEYSTLKNHLDSIKIFLLLFLGFLLAYTFWTIILPESMISSSFGIQEDTYSKITQLSGISGSAIYPSNLNTIISNNFRVLILSLILALFYGAGSIFILVWNASIMGFVIGSLARHSLSLSHLPRLFLKYFLHGIPEILAYLIVALAGSILFVSIVREDIKEGKMKRIITDVPVLILISIVILIIAGLIEVYISPFI